MDTWELRPCKDVDEDVERDGQRSGNTLCARGSYDSAAADEKSAADVAMGRFRAGYSLRGGRAFAHARNLGEVRGVLEGPEGVVGADHGAGVGADQNTDAKRFYKARPWMRLSRISVQSLPLVGVMEKGEGVERDIFSSVRLKGMRGWNSWRGAHQVLLDTLAKRDKESEAGKKKMKELKTRYSISHKSIFERGGPRERIRDRRISHTQDIFFGMPRGQHEGAKEAGGEVSDGLQRRNA